MNVKRLFIATDIKPEPEFLDFFETIKGKLEQDAIKWVDSTIFHLTLKFLGDTDIARIEAIKSVLEKISAGVEPFDSSLRGLGYFGSSRDPKVLFAGIEGTDLLTTLSYEINKQLFGLGIEPEEKSFKAHLTLGRIKSIRNRDNFMELVRVDKATFFQACRIGSIILYESILRPQGPKYIAVAKFRLGK